MNQAIIENTLGLNAQAISYAAWATSAWNHSIPHTETGGCKSYIGDVYTKLFNQKMDDLSLNLDCLKTIVS